MSAPEFWNTIAADLAAQVSTWLPRLLVAVLVLVVGWVVALVAQSAVRGLLRRIGIDRLSEKAGFSDTLAEMRMDRSAASLLGRVVYWLVVIFFVSLALEGLGLTAVTETLQLLVGYLPNVLAALLVLILGSFIAHLAGDAIAALASQYGVSGSMLLGQSARWTLIFFAVILTLEQLHLDTSLITYVVLVFLGAAALALALALGLGTRDLAGQMVAGAHAREAFRIGDRIRVGGSIGELQRIGPATAIIETEDGYLSIPNHQLLTTEVTIVARSTGPSETAGQGPAD